MSVYDMDHWCRTLDVVSNRVDIINQMLGYGVPGLSENPCKLVYDHGKYKVNIRDAELCEFALYDQREIDAALCKVDGANDMVWYALRSHLLAVPVS